MIRSSLSLAALLLLAAAAVGPQPLAAERAIAVASVATGQAAAPQQPLRKQLRSELLLNREIVSFGDLIDGLSPEAAAIPAFRAPALGETGTIQVSRIIDAARAAGIIRSGSEIDGDGALQVVVTREARRILASDIEAAVKLALQERYGIDARAFALAIDGGAPAVVVEPELSGAVAVSDLSFDARSRRLQARIAVPGSAAMQLKPVRFGGQLVETVEVVVPKRAIARGETLGRDDVRVERRPRDGQLGDLLADPRTAIDKVARRALIAGLPLRAGDVQREEIVAKGDLVTIVYESRGLTISMRGRANDAGAMGDVVTATNPQSKRVLQGTVSGPGRVSVQANSAGRIASAQ